MKKTKAQLIEQIAELNKAIEESNKTNEKANDIILSMKKKVNDYETAISEKNKEISKFNADDTVKNNTIKELQDINTNLNVDVQKQVVELNDCYKRIEELKSGFDDTESENAILIAKNKKLNVIIVLISILLGAVTALGILL